MKEPRSGNVTAQPEAVTPTAFTPGPWQAYGKMVRAGGRTVCNAQRPPLMTEAEGTRLAIERANANLIAAAPSLYAVCKRVVTIWGEDCGDHCSNACLACQARAAIAKAGQK